MNNEITITTKPFAIFGDGLQKLSNDGINCFYEMLSWMKGKMPFERRNIHWVYRETQRLVLPRIKFPFVVTFMIGIKSGLITAKFELITCAFLTSFLFLL